MGGKGIGEIFFWHRSILVYFMDESVPKALQNQVYEQHVIKSKKQRVNLKKYPFSILCTRVQN
jgi:hypothetical protein